MVSNAGSENWPPGRPPLSRGFVDEFKRERCAAALSEAAREVGVTGVTVAHVTKRARISRGTFYELFSGIEEATHYATNLGHERLRCAIEGAVDQEASRDSRVESAIGALFETAAAEPFLAELGLRCGARPGPLAPEIVDALVAIMRPDRPGPGDAEPVPVESFLALGILSVLAQQLRQGGTDGLGGLRRELVKMAKGLLPTAP